MLATTIHKSNTTPHHQSRATTRQPPLKGVAPPPVSPNRDEEIAGLLPQSPIVCLMISSPVFPHRLNVCCAPTGHPLQGPALISQPRTPHTCEARGNENGAP